MLVAQEEQEGGVRYVEESTTPDEGDFAPPPIDLLQSLYAREWCCLLTHRRHTGPRDLLLAAVLGSLKLLN